MLQHEVMLFGYIKDLDALRVEGSRIERLI